MFYHPAWAVGIYSSGPPAAGTVRYQAMGSFYLMCRHVRGLGQSLRISRPNVFILTSCGRINLGKKKLWWLPSKLNKKPREKHSVASPPRVFHSVFCFVCQWSHLSFFASVDPATIGEYKLLNSYLSIMYVWIWYMRHKHFMLISRPFSPGLALSVNLP